MSTDSDIIEGVPLDIPGDELSTMLEKVADYHTQRAEDYRTDLERIQAKDEDPAIEQYSGDNPVEKLESRVQKHRDKAAMRRLQAKYVVPEETYRISKTKVKSLGINHIL